MCGALAARRGPFARCDAFLAAVVLLVSAPAWAQDITGPARVIDGDTIDISGQRIRLHGIDAPDTKQLCDLGMMAMSCGREATKRLRRLVRGGQVRCEERDRDRYDRIVAVCFNSDGRDVGKAMLRNGWALAYRQFSLDYVVDEDRAKAAGSGIVNHMIARANDEGKNLFVWDYYEAMIRAGSL